MMRAQLKAQEAFLESEQHLQLYEPRDTRRSRDGRLRSYTGEHNFELEFRKVHAARELICRVVGAERPGGGLANEVKTDSLNHAIDSDESRRRVKTAEIHSDTTHGRRGTVRVQPRTPDSKKKQRSSENKQVPGSLAQYLHSPSSLGRLHSG